MPFATITNTSGLEWAVPRLNLVLGPGASATVYLEDADGFLGDARVTSDIESGRFTVTVSSSDPGGSYAADEIGVDASGFSGNLSAADTNVQLMAGTLDALAPGGDVSGTIGAMVVDAIGGVAAPVASAEGELLQYDAGSGDYIATVVPWSIKSGTVAAGSFAGGPPASAAVAFSTAWPDANYSVTATTVNNGTHAATDVEVSNIAVGGFTLWIAATANVVTVNWTAVRFYNP